HTPRVNGRSDMSKVGAGGRQFETLSGGVITSANLTPANDDGIAHWTDAEIKHAITHGVRPGRALIPVMAFDWYKNISSDDLDALVAYLRSLRPAMPWRRPLEQYSRWLSLSSRNLELSGGNVS